jgi:hypothetical protein
MSEPETPIIVSGKDSSNGVIIKTTLQDADITNRNKRMYPKSVLLNGLKSEYILERLATHSWFGECGHPLEPNLARQLYLDQTRISHRINDIWWEKNKLKAYVEATPTVHGKEFGELIKSGMKAAFSMRAVGPVVEKRGDVTVILDPLTIFAYDWVIHPSHRVAYMDTIETNPASAQVNESANDIFIPYSESGDILSYIKDQSKNLKIFAESFDMDMDNMALSEDLKTVYAKQHNGDTFAIRTEEVIRKEIEHYNSNIFSSRF